MKKSPLQLLQTTLLKLSIEPVVDGRFTDRRPSNPYEYDHVVLETSKNCSKFQRYWDSIPVPVEGIQEKTYYVQLGIRTPLGTDNVGPYKFEIVYGGVIAVLPDRRMNEISDDDLALQYGLTLLYGVVREQLGALTYRMSWGQAMLPTMTFMDEKSLATVVSPEVAVFSAPA